MSRPSRRIQMGICLGSLLASLLATSPSQAFEPDEVRAILLNRPSPPPGSVERIVLATQKRISLRSDGSSRIEEHLLIMASGGFRDDSLSIRWTFRPELDRMRLLTGVVHGDDGSAVPMGPGSTTVTACAAAGPEGYPDLADFVVTARGVAPGEAIELRVLTDSSRTFRSQFQCGEHRFSSPDSVVESWLTLEIPATPPLLLWPRGPVPPPSERLEGGVARAVWLTGNLAPGSQGAQTPLFTLLAQPPDSSTAEPVLWWAFVCDWDELVQSRSAPWRYSLRFESQGLSAVAAQIQAEHASALGREEAALRWVRDTLEEIEIPAARLWFEPAEPQAVFDRRAAIPRDRALVLAWLLRRMGIPADVASVGGRSPIQIEAVFPQQLDTWLVRSGAVPGETRWIGVEGEDSPSKAPPAGAAILWTGEDGVSPIVPFPGRLDR